MGENKTTKAKRSLHLKLHGKKATDFRSSLLLKFNYILRKKQRIFGEVLFSSLKIDRKMWSKFLVKCSLPPGSNLYLRHYKLACIGSLRILQAHYRTPYSSSKNLKPNNYYTPGSNYRKECLFNKIFFIF